MQFKQVLFGCVASYFVGVILVMGLSIRSMEIGSFMELLQTLVFVMFVGAIIATLVSALVFVIWAILAGYRVVVAFWWAPLVAAVGLIVLPFGIGELDFQTAAMVAFLGLLFGGSFWITAFGWRYSVQMHFGRPPKTQEMAE